MMSAASPSSFRPDRYSPETPSKHGVPLPAGPMSAASSAPGPSGLAWVNGAPVLRMEDAVVETVVTHTTTTTTSFAPIALPRITPPETIALPRHLAPETFPLANEPTPDDLKVFTLNLGGKNVTIQEEGVNEEEADALGTSVRGPGWVKTLGKATISREARRLGLTDAFANAKGKERKRPHESRPGSRTRLGQVAPEMQTPLSMTEPPKQRSSPPRKKIRGLDDLTIPHDHNNIPLSPLPSPDHEAGPVLPSPHHTTQSPSVGSGMEVAALFSMPAIISHFDSLPDKLQQHVLMHLFRRSRMPTIQRLSAFASTALKRDFISHLPHEIAVQILKKVDTKSLASATRVSRKWQRMIDSERAVWQQRLVDDGLWYGHGVEEDDEAIIQRRYEALDWQSRPMRPSKAGTPSEDDSMPSAYPSGAETDVERPVPLKHVYRRRHTSNKNWLGPKYEHSTFPGHGTNVVTCLQFDRDKIVSASDDHSINIYNTADGRLRKRLDGHEGGVWALEYKGDTLVSGSTDRTVRVWDLETLQEAHVFHGHTSTVRCLQIVEPVFEPSTGEYQPPYPMIVTGSRDATLRVWKLPKKGEPSIRPIPGHNEAEASIVPPEHNPFHLHHLEGHASAVRALAAHGRVCVSGSYDKTVRVWDIVKGTCIHVLHGHEQKVYSIVYDRHRHRCASGSMDNTVKVWDVVTGECLHTLHGHTSLVGLLGTSPNFLVSAAADASLRIWDANTHQLKHVLASHGGAITCFQHDETKVVSGSDGTLKLWDIQTGAYVRDLVIGISSVWQVAFHGSLLVAASNRGGSTVFDVFDFGQLDHISGVDDDRLDTLRRPPWERDNPMEPHTYQGEDSMEVDNPHEFGGATRRMGVPLSRLSIKGESSSTRRHRQQPVTDPSSSARSGKTATSGISYFGSNWGSNRAVRRSARLGGHADPQSPSVAGPASRAGFDPSRAVPLDRMRPLHASGPSRQIDRPNAVAHRIDLRQPASYPRAVAAGPSTSFTPVFDEDMGNDPAGGHVEDDEEEDDEEYEDNM